MHFDPDEYMDALVDQGPWPAQLSTRTDPTTVVDVDIAGNYAAVLAVVDDPDDDGEVLLEEALFVRGPDGWAALGGGASGNGEDPMLERERLDPDVTPLTLRGSGSCSIEPWTGLGRYVHNAQLLCSPHVVRVEVERTGARRIADVSRGPGWLVVVWGRRDAPIVTAFDANGRPVEVLRPEAHRKEAEARFRRHRLRQRLRPGQAPEQWRKG